MKNFQKIIAVLALSGMCLAAPAPSDSDVAAKKARKHHAPKTEAAAPACAACSEIKQLKDTVSSQQAEINQLQNARPAVAAPDPAAAAAAAAAQQKADAAAAAAADASAKAAAAQAEVAGIKAETDANAAALAAEKKKVDYLEHPASIAYKWIRITPGGYFDLTGYYRQHQSASGPAGPATNFNATALGNNLLGASGLSEFGASARATRLSVRADADAGATKLTGYFEGDFFGNTFATPNQTTAYGLRIRQGWGRAKFPGGWSITGGQMWNSATMNRRAADADAVWIPNTIDANYVVGFNWGRQAELRLAKTFAKTVTFSLGIVDPSYLGGSTTNTAIAGLASTGTQNLGNTVCTPTVPAAALSCATATDTYSTNLAPDLIVKLAIDSPKAGHFEVKAIQRFFRDRVVGSAAVAGPPAVAAVPSYNNVTYGYGVGGGFIVPIVPKKLDLVAQGMVGKGVSRYVDGQVADFVVRNKVANTIGGDDNNLQPIISVSSIIGFETHPTSKLEFDAWGGDEYYYRTLYSYTFTSGPDAGRHVRTGYASPFGATGTTKNLLEGTVVLWYDIYKGSFGTLRYGAQYEYIERTTWVANNAGFTNIPASHNALIAPKGIDNVGMVSMRYILP